ncbi:glutaminase A [Nocardioides sp. Root190]|uniref:glutaminase A n=1 Tax=Nocardioides sp. Root190 TaxID=1736488 RepID=UPI00190FEA2D|nr:glutaminase A [Nocardioides sp. Root190]
MTTPTIDGPAATRDLTGPALMRHAERAAELGRSVARTGAVTAKIPELAKVDAGAFGFSVATVEGTELGVGDSDVQFSLQSITKLFALVALLQIEPTAWEHVGWAPTELGYGSVTELERAAGRPRNPFVNAGALIVTDRLLRHTGSAVGRVSTLLRELSGDSATHSDAAVAASEAAADHRNRALAHVLAEHGRLLNPVEDVLGEYYAQCAITGSVLGLARGARFLADRRLHRLVLDSDNIRRINAVLLTSGMYGAAGDIAYRIGLPAKSGVGGGILAALPGVGTVCAWSPPLDLEGNSVGGVAALEHFARTSGWSVF